MEELIKLRVRMTFIEAEIMNIRDGIISVPGQDTEKAIARLHDKLAVLILKERQLSKAFGVLTIYP